MQEELTALKPNLIRTVAETERLMATVQKEKTEVGRRRCLDGRGGRREADGHRAGGEDRGAYGRGGGGGLASTPRGGGKGERGTDRKGTLSMHQRAFMHATIPLVPLVHYSPHHPATHRPPPEQVVEPKKAIVDTDVKTAEAAAAAANAIKTE